MNDVAVTYWMNRLQGIDEDKPLFVSLNPPFAPDPDLTFGKYMCEHPQYNAAAFAAQKRLAKSRAGATPGFAAPGPAMVFMKMACAPALRWRKHWERQHPGASRRRHSRRLRSSDAPADVDNDPTTMPPRSISATSCMRG